MSDKIKVLLSEEEVSKKLDEMAAVLNLSLIHI